MLTNIMALQACQGKWVEEEGSQGEGWSEDWLQKKGNLTRLL